MISKDLISSHTISHDLSRAPTISRDLPRSQVAEHINHLARPCHERTAEEVGRRVRDMRKAGPLRSNAAPLTDRVADSGGSSGGGGGGGSQPSKASSAAVAGSAASKALAAGSAASGPKLPTPRMPSDAMPPPPGAPAASKAASEAAAEGPPLPKAQADPSLASHPKAANPKAADPKAQLDPSTDPWSVEQQQALETALKAVPASVGVERWDRISEQVAGKTKGECVKRYKEIVAALKAKKQAEA